MKENRIDKVFREQLGGLQGLPDDVRWNRENGWLAFEQRYGRNRLSVIGIRGYLGIAAGILLILISVFLFQKRPSEMLSIINDSKYIREITLPDGNHVWLRPNSTIDYSSQFNTIQNEIAVTGEVYFELFTPSDAVYKISIYNALILAESNCAFNIRGLDQEEHVDITLANGAIKVRDVSYEAGLTLLVPEGNYCSVHKSQSLVYSSVNTNANYLSWKTGKLTFENMPIATVTDILAEYYLTNIEFEDKALAYCRFTGTFSGESIDNVLHNMQKDLNIVIRNDGDRFIISGKGCL
jgi:ferric-dicitrate binding protein FerR (iron transport regulator)